MKKDYGLVNREEGPLFGTPALPRRDDRKASKRFVAIGSSVLLLAAGAVLGYAALPSRSPPVAEVSNLEVNALDGAQGLNIAESQTETQMSISEDPIATPLYAIAPQVAVPISHAYMPPIAEFDLDLDGLVSVEEYLHRQIRRHDSILNRVEASSMSDVAKDFITDRLRRNYAKEAWCVAQIAAKDIEAGGMAMKDFMLFYSMIQETCDIYDPEIPREYQPGDKPLPTEAPIDPTMPTPTPMIKQPIRKFKPGDIPEGHAIKCEWNDADVFRYTKGTRRYYPDPAIAASWDPFWRFALAADCSVLPRGDDMELNGSSTPAPRTKMSPQSLREGQAMKCEWDEPEVYRFSNGYRRWYPNPEIASSWDPYWGSAVVVECVDLPRGEDMQMYGPPQPTPFRVKIPPALLIEGQPIKCDFNEPEVYRFTNSERRWYPSPEIAASWDPNWGAFVEADCTTLPRGKDMDLNTVPTPWTPPVKLTPGELKEGQAIKCEWDEPEVYRFTGDLRRWYPNPETASSWDPFWTSAVVADCTLILRGDDMAMKDTPLPTPPSLPPSYLREGQAVTCSPNPDLVYRFTNGEYRFYPTAEIAASWDLNWMAAVAIDCSLFLRGEDMKMNSSPTLPPKLPPSSLHEGQAIRCESDESDVYRFTDGMRRLYPTPEIATSWDPYWDMNVIADCSLITRGDDMQYNGVPPTPSPPVKIPPALLYEGQAIKCDELDEVFRYTEGLRRLYPSRKIADSWDPYWTAAVLADCTTVARGDDMPLKTPTIRNGQTIRCDDSTPNIYRYWDGTIFEYRDPAVAESWDAGWIWSVIIVDCTSLSKGPFMQKKLPPPLNLPEGQTIKCGVTQNDLYRYTSGMRRLYPTTLIANSWDPSWDSALEIDCSSLPRGDDMEFRQPPLVEGLAISCDDSTSIFRYTNGTIRLYPSWQIANSWDSMWYHTVRVNCSRLFQGPNMQMKPVSPTSLREGQSVRCVQDETGVYRYACGELRPYGNSKIATSWDPYWSEAVLADCSLLRFGPAMKFNQPPLYDGQTTKCSPDSHDIFRYSNGTIRQYFDWRVARSWDPSWQVTDSYDSFWRNATVVYCSAFPQGPEMRFNLGKLIEGQPIKCERFETDVYRYASGQRRLYPTAEIATSWDPFWDEFVVVDCTRVPRGDDMKYNLPIVPEDRTVQCINSPSLYYRYTNGTLRLYPSTEIARTWDLSWTDPLYIDCTGFPQGPPMTRRLPSPFSLPEGQSIKCSDDAVEVYRYTSGMRRLYPSQEIALSWDPFWENSVVVDCTLLPPGSNMPSKWQLKEGETVRCSNGTRLYRYTNGTLRLYPTNAVALSWDPNALAASTTIDCLRYLQGPVMSVKSPLWIPEGQAIKCAATDLETYRYACGDRRLYPSAEIAASWDLNWKNPMVVDCKWIFSSYPMQMYQPPVPSSLVEEQTVKCPGESTYYRFCSGELRQYWNDRIGRSWDRNYVSNSVSLNDCTSLRKGNSLFIRKPNIPEGQAVACDTTGAVYRYENLILRRYPTQEIAQSWDSNWMNPVGIECEFFPTLDDMPPRYPRFSLSEGQSTKCELHKTDYYRYASGMLRWYPNALIAQSWDPNWSKNFTVVNCSTYSRGPNMELKQPPLSDGQPVKCDDGPNTYRYTNNTVRLYPTPAIAASWDPMYFNATRANCSKFFLDIDMTLKLPPPTGLPEGQAIKCDPNEAEVYRLTGGQRRWYPSPYIATSWDENWGNAVLIDCSNVPKGPPMLFNQPFIYQYQAIKCDEGSAVYRYANGIIRLYPSPEIATSWDPQWMNAVKADCSNFTVGQWHDYRLRSPADLREGQAIRCGETHADVYRLTGGQMRWYPTALIASSWDPSWEKSIVVECSDLPIGRPMSFNNPILTNGQAIKCDDGPAVYQYSNGTIRWYPSEEIAWSWDANWKSAVFVDCAYFAKGPQLDFNLPPPFRFPEGQAIKCNPSESAVYRLASGQYRWYPSPSIATSWDPYWNSAVAVDCTYLTRGDDMKYKQPPIVEGQPVKCDDGPMIFRYVNGSIHWYPSPEIAASWDSNWMYPIFVDCSVLPRGLDLNFRLVNGWTQLDGSMVQLSFDGKQLCGVTSDGDAWCTSENFRGKGVTKWRRLPGKFSQVVVYGDVLYGVDSGYNLHVGSAISSDPAWSQLPGSFKHISTDNKQLCGVTPTNVVQCANANIRTAPNWRTLAGAFSQVELVNGRLFGVRDGIGLFTGHASGEPDWFYLHSPMQQVSFDGLRVCGTNGGEVKCASSGLSIGPQWSKSLGNMNSVVAHAGDMFGVSSLGEVYYRALE